MYKVLNITLAHELKLQMEFGSGHRKGLKISRPKLCLIMFPLLVAVYCYQICDYSDSCVVDIVFIKIATIKDLLSLYLFRNSHAVLSVIKVMQHLAWYVQDVLVSGVCRQLR